MSSAKYQLSGVKEAAGGQFSLPQAFKIIEIRAENAATKTFVLDGRLAAEPGQFAMVWLPGQEDKPFSLANADPLTLTIAAVGSFSNALHRLYVGDYLWVRGPLGRGYHLPDKPGRHILLIGGGYGVAPLLFLARKALAAGQQVAMIIGARTKDGLLLVQDFETLGVSLQLTTEDGSAGQRGLVTDALATMIASVSKPDEVYACGPVGMLQAIAARCQAENISTQLSWEAHMRCGLGLCGSCEIGLGWLTCLDGPVFEFNPLTIPPDKSY
jgi:dihydroorotate dehydrogenase electron transfer subunit